MTRLVSGSSLSYLHRTLLHVQLDSVAHGIESHIASREPPLSAMRGTVDRVVAPRGDQVGAGGGSCPPAGSRASAGRDPVDVLDDCIHTAWMHAQRRRRQPHGALIATIESLT